MCRRHESSLKAQIETSPRTNYKRSKNVLTVTTNALILGHIHTPVSQCPVQSLIGSPETTSNCHTKKEIFWTVRKITGMMTQKSQNRLQNRLPLYMNTDNSIWSKIIARSSFFVLITIQRISFNHFPIQFVMVFPLEFVESIWQDD